METNITILVFNTTTDKELEDKPQVCYKDIDGHYSKIGRITDIFESEGFTYYLLDIAMGSYLAEELKLIKRTPKTTL